MRLSIPAPKMPNISSRPNIGMSKLSKPIKFTSPKFKLPSRAKAPKPFEPRNRRFNPAPNKSSF